MKKFVSFLARNWLQLCAVILMGLTVILVGILLVTTKPTVREASLETFVLTVFSILASILCTKLYAEKEYNQTVRDHGVQIGTVIIVLKGQLAALSQWLGRKRASKRLSSNSDASDSLILEHAELTLNNFQSSTDVALKGIASLIGDAYAQFETMMEKVAQLRREENQQKSYLEEEWEAATSSTEAFRLQTEIKAIESETEKKILELQRKSPLPLPSQSPKGSFAGRCPYCAYRNVFELADRIGETRPIICGSCGNGFNAHVVSGHKILTKARGALPTFKSKIQEILKRKGSFVEPNAIATLIQMTLLADTSLRTQNIRPTEEQLLKAIFAKGSQLVQAGVSHVAVRRLIKLIFQGGGFVFAHGITPGLKSEYAPLNEEALISAVTRSLLRKIAEHEALSNDIAAELNDILFADRIPAGERIIAKEISTLGTDAFGSASLATMQKSESSTTLPIPATRKKKVDSGHD